MCSCNHFSFAQQYDVDSLKKALQGPLPDKERVLTLNGLAFMYFDIKPDSAQPLIEEAFQLAKNNHDSSGLASCENAMGWMFYLRGESDTAVRLIKKASVYYENIKDSRDAAITYVNLSQVFYHAQKNYVAALEYSTKAAAINETLKDTISLISVYTIIGMIYRDQQQYDAAILNFNKAIELAEATGNKYSLTNTFTALGILYLRKNDLANARLYFTRSFDLANETDRAYGKAMAKENLGDVYFAMKDFPQALTSYQYALNYFRRNGQKEDWGFECINTGKVQHAMKNYDEAIASFQTALQLFDETGSRVYLPEVHEALSNTYLARGDYKNAFGYYQLFIAERDSIFSQAQKKQLAELTTKYQTGQKEKENLLLKAENATSVIKLQRNRAWLIAAGISLLLLSMLTYIIYRNRQDKIKNIRELETLNDQLKQQKEEISRMNSILELRALRAQMNPHFIFNCMSSIQECILTGKIDDANRYLSKLSRLLRMVLEYSEQESVSLDKELEMLELYLQLESVRLKDNFKYEIEVDKAIFPEEVQVPVLILQPFAENAIWHGLLPKEKDRLLKIKIESGIDSINCIVEDNGVGREKSAALHKLKKRHHQSKGISIVRNRLTILRHRSPHIESGFEIIDLYTAPHVPAGTRVEIKLPLEATAL
jgi:tetratricopeptide (TPR) repeat protein